jgi:hypothetical protein
MLKYFLIILSLSLPFVLSFGQKATFNFKEFYDDEFLKGRFFSDSQNTLSVAVKTSTMAKRNLKKVLACVDVTRMFFLLSSSTTMSMVKLFLLVITVFR